MGIQVQRLSDVVIVETQTGQFIDPNDPTVTTRLKTSTSAPLTSITVPPVTKYSAFQKALSAGTGTIDLTSLPDNNGNAGAVTFNGLQIICAKFRNPSTNANSITIKLGGSNGHALFTSSGIVLQPGEVWTYEGIDAGTEIAGGAKTWDLTGTGSQALDVLLVAG